jgi:2-polyprenyl-3-methyl-5-hydroxy-6-metoxy-1,4-benzoquinol methylase
MSFTTEQVKEFFNRPVYLDKGRFLIEVRASLVRDLVGRIPRGRIVDLGCGDGSISIPFLSEANELTLVDLSERMLGLAADRIPEQARQRVRLVNASLGDFEPPAPFDLAICVGVLAHVRDIDEAAKKIAQCVHVGGAAIVEFTPNPNPLAKVLFPYYWLRGVRRGSVQGYETNKMPLAQLLVIFKRHGLELAVLRRHFFPLPTMAWWSQRLLSRYAVFATRSRLVSRIGTEHLMLFKKSVNS